VIGDRISKLQFGFQPQKGCRDCIYILRRIIEKVIEYNREVHLVFIDLEKAYDLVDRDKVWVAIKELGADDSLIAAIKSFYKDNKVAVRINDKLSEFFRVKRGLRQGCPLSPLLFIATFNKICEKLSAAKGGFPLGNQLFLNLLAFADDGTLIGMDFEEIEFLLRVFEEGCQELGLKINVPKTQYMICGNSESDKELFINGQKLEKVTSFKYLGSIVCSDGKIDAEISARIAKAGSCFGAMNKFMGNRGQVRLETKIKVMKCVIVPTLMYACESWNWNDSHKDRINVCEMRWLRIILGVNIMDFVRNVDIRLACGGIVETTKLVEKQRLSYLGHLIRTETYDESLLIGQMYRWVEPTGWKRPKGRPQSRWFDDFDDSLRKVGLVEYFEKRKRNGEIEIWFRPDWLLINLVARDKDQWRQIKFGVVYLEEWETGLFNPVGVGD
jgi:hypothetical protein